MADVRAFALALLTSPLASTAMAQTAPAPHPTGSVIVLVTRPGSTLTIRGSTTVGARWQCSARDIDTRVAVAPTASDDGSGLPDVRGVAVHVPVSALRCQSRPMERAMRHALKADRDTAALVITGRFEIADDLPPTHANERILIGPLRVAGTERNVLLHSAVAYQPDGSLRVQSRIPLLLTSFGIELPRVLFGAIRARDAVTVEVDLLYPRPVFGVSP